MNCYHQTSQKIALLFLIGFNIALISPRSLDISYYQQTSLPIALLSKIILNISLLSLDQPGRFTADVTY